MMACRSTNPPRRSQARSRWSGPIGAPARNRHTYPPNPRAPAQSARSGKTVRLRDKDHLKFVARQACLVCGRAPSDPHHLRFTQARALGRRVSDEFTVPVCRIHHRELHRHADEAAWWDQVKIDPLPVALRLWQHTRRNGELAPTNEDQQYSPARRPDMSVSVGVNPDQCPAGLKNAY
jgi:hypothetical protein